MPKGWRQIAARLAGMDRREMLVRGRQELAKHVDAMRAGLGFNFADGAIVGENADLGRFFFGPDAIGSILDTLRRRLPTQVEHIQQQADKICSHRFDLLGYENLDYGDPIHWHLDAVHGKTAPRKIFHKIRYLDFEEVGDSKITWELSRHQQLVTLAKAYRLTQDGRYAQELQRQWQHWHEENPYPVGIHWASSLEVAFRSLSWLWMFHILEGSAAMSADFRDRWLRAQAVSGRHIERYLSTYFSPNTHLLGEGVALFFLGVLCPRLADARRWKSLGWEIVQNESKRQVQSDGFHFEGSTYYHVYAVDFFLHAWLLAKANEIAIPPDFARTVERMLQALSQLGRAGAPPRFGDDDGGRLFDPRRNRSEHLLDPLSAGAVLFHRPDFKALAGGLREETVWLLGAPGVDEFDRLHSQAPRLEPAGLPQAGLYLAVSQPRTQMVIYAGRRGEHSTGHMHADALSICLQSAGETLLMDPGAFEYVGKSGARDRFRSTGMHNTLRVGEASQSEPSGPFSWRRRARATVEHWIEGETFSLFCGSHDGYAQHSPPVVHRRWVVALKCGLFLVRDVAEGWGETQLDISWHLGPAMEWEGNSSFRAKGSLQGLVVLAAQHHGWKEETLETKWSPSYGSAVAATALNFSAKANLPAEFATLLLPHDPKTAAPGLLTRVTHDSSPEVHAYSYELADEQHLFCFAPSRPWRCRSVESDAGFVYWKRGHGGENEVVILCDGSYVEIDERRVLSSRRVVSRCELVAGSAGHNVFCSEPDALEKPPAQGLVSDGPANGRDTQPVAGDREV